MPPLVGTRDFTAQRDRAPLIDELHVEPLLLPGASVLQAMFEINDAHLLEMLPSAVHPTIPPMAAFSVWECPEGPLGPFRLAQVRVMCRAAFRSRGLLLAAYCDSAPASEALRRHWGFDCRPGAVEIDHHFDTITGTVEAEGREILRFSLVDPIFLSGADLEPAGNFHFARVLRNGVESARLVQVEPQYTIERPDRGRPRLHGFEPSAWSAEGLVAEFPVAALHFRCELRLPAVRYLADPDRPLAEGTEFVGEERQPAT